jgi:propanol-preferring alcohol dehydrogenase
MAAGLCQSDNGLMNGHVPLWQPWPAILGHEYAGIITKIGPDVTGFEVGDAVAPATGPTDVPGVTREGAYSEYLTALAKTLVKLPAGFDWGQAAAATDAGMTAYTGVAVTGGVKAGDKVGIVGLGGIGLTAARIAVLLGAAVYGAEPKTEVWGHARAAGVKDVFSSVAEMAGLGLDVIVDYAGVGVTTAGALKVIRPGGTVVVVGMGALETTFTTSDLVVRNVRLLGCSPLGVVGHMETLLKMMVDGDLTILANPIAFDQIPEGLARLERQEVVGRLYADMSAE